MTNSLLPVLTRTRHSRSTRGRRICMVPSREWPTETPNRIAVYRGFVARTDVPTDGRLLSCCQTSNFIRRSVELPRAATLDEAAPTERGSVRASVTEQTPNKRDSVPLLFGCSVLDLEFVPETGGTAMAHELVDYTSRCT